MSVHVRCAAKINLYLDVLRRRDDGYHDIETILQPVSLYDEMVISRAPTGVSVTGDDPAVPWDETNLCARAARVLFRHVGFEGGAAISVRKRIPAGAGLGGGSADAAATLLGLNELMGFGVPARRLSRLALEIGSDVPFFLLGSPAVGRGRGDILEGIDGLATGWVLVVKPNVTVSTKWAYSHPNLLLTAERGGATLTSVLNGLRSVPGRKLVTYNSFERIVTGRFPEIRSVLAALGGEGALLYALSGTGAACFALFDTETEAKEAQRHITEKGFFSEVVRPVFHAIELLQTNM
jgi:4-diphosphocytidyl-2-C-methyl-D-erythritol kinase